MCVFWKYAFKKQIKTFINHCPLYETHHYVKNINGNQDNLSKIIMKYSDYGIVDIDDFVYPSFIDLMIRYLL